MSLDDFKARGGCARHHAVVPRLRDNNASNPSPPSRNSAIPAPVGEKGSLTGWEACRRLQPCAVVWQRMASVSLLHLASW